MQSSLGPTIFHFTTLTFSVIQRIGPHSYVMSFTACPSLAPCTIYYSSLLKFKTNSCQKMFGPPQTNSKRMFKSPVNYGLVPTKSKGMFGRVPPDTHCKCTHSCAAILSYMLTEVNSSILQYDQTFHGTPQLASATRD